MCKPFTDDQRLSIFMALKDYAKDVDKYPTFELVCVAASAAAIGEYVSSWSIRNWAKKEELYHDYLSEALLLRAEDYMRKAHKVVEEVEEFWDAPFADPKGNIYILKKERLTAVNRAKLQLEHYRYHASNLAPDIYGDYKYELKKMEVSIANLQNQLNEITKKG